MLISSAKNSEQRDLFRGALEMMVLPCIRRLVREVLSFEQMLKGISLVLSPIKP
jgi:hypothetical protein